MDCFSLLKEAMATMILPRLERQDAMQARLVDLLHSIIQVFTRVTPWVSPQLWSTMGVEW